MDRNRVITFTIDQEVQMMNTHMQKSPPKLLQKFAGKECCCIFRVPQSLMEINKEAYQPQIVSIGPYYHGSKNLEMIQEHKWRFLDGFISRTGKPLKSLLDTILSKEKEIRESYSESIEHISIIDLGKMMVLDGVFLIELFRKVVNFDPKDQDPILQMVWVVPFLMRDFLKIENQIPFVVLQTLFNDFQTKTDNVTLPTLILEFFNRAFNRPKDVLKQLSKSEKLKARHLLDFCRKSFMEETTSKGNETTGHVVDQPNQDLSDKACLEGKHFLDFFSKKHRKENHSIERIQPATKLVVAGVKLKKNEEAKSFLDIKFQNGILSIPQINLDDFYTCFILNGTIFEQCYSKCTKGITTYIVFLGWLVNTPMDVGLLSERKIIQNHLGTDKELLTFINNARKDLVFDINNNYLKKEIKDIDKYCKNGWHVVWAGFEHTYFESPWTFISAFAAFVLLSLAGIQTFYTVYPYYYERT